MYRIDLIRVKYHRYENGLKAGGMPDAAVCQFAMQLSTNVGKKRDGCPRRQPSLYVNFYEIIELTFSDSEHLRSAGRAGPLSRRFLVLHFDGFGIAHFPLLATFHTVCLH